MKTMASVKGKYSLNTSEITYFTLPVLDLIAGRKDYSNSGIPQVMYKRQ